ncbi:hypothetical protein [Loktanella sp. Alg231-35]|uniref:hypothetical protein n=1 Tax=Loktanella sp. Alg231-35 TaxID=1922220 RepID=UPI000D553EA3|nr:hypothetical protein [Loktanella sp. Alg231-35]
MLGLDPEKEKPFDPNWVSPDKDAALRSQRILISIIGLTAILLPPAVVIVDRFAPSPCFRDSLSHYFYSQRAGVVFVMTLAFIGTLLSSYRAEARFVRRLAIVAGMAGLLVAVFPTEGPGCTEAAFTARMFGSINAETPMVVFATAFILFPGVGTIHYIAAFVLFAIMLYFCAIVFRRSGAQDRDPDTQALLVVKRKRNRIYAACALVIAAAMIVMGLSQIDAISGYFSQRVILYGEAVALWAFGIAWLVKGRLFDTSLGA